jgi:hypothetical protein
MRVPDELRGQKVRCPTCQDIFLPASELPRDPAPPTGPRYRDEPPTLTPFEGPPVEATPGPPRPGFGFVELDLSLDEKQPPAAGCRAPEAPPPRAPEPPPPAPGPVPAPRRPQAPARGEHDRRACPKCGGWLERGMRRCPHCDAGTGVRDVDVRLPRRLDSEPDRSGLVLTLGILSLVCPLICCGPGGVVLGIMAWVMGQADLARMRDLRVNPDGQGLTQAGWICGIIGTVLGVLATLFLFIFFVASAMDS